MTAMRSHKADNYKSLRKHTPPRFIAVDFFCGAGGTTCGLLGAGGYVVAGIDKDPEVAETFRRNNRNRHLDRAFPEFLNFDIFEESPSYPQGQQEKLFDRLNTLLVETRTMEPDAPLMFAICGPCQPFTTLARKEMTADRQKKRAKDRGLLEQATRFVKVYEPDFVLSENVAGIGEERYGGVWQQFRDDLQALGYAVGSEVVNAADFCVPQFRKRSILLAVKLKNAAKRHTNAVGLEVPLTRPRARQISVRETIGHFPRLAAGQTHDVVANHQTRTLSDLNKLRLRVSKPGESNASLEDSRFGDLSLPCHKRVNKKFKQRCFNDVYTRMHPDRPSPTITTKCHSISNGRFGHYDRKQLRGISLREAAALQTFPDGYVFHTGNKIGATARLIGNAVPPKLSRFFANYLVSGAAERSLFESKLVLRD